MRILALDTCSRVGSAALFEDDRLVSSYLLDMTVKHSERVLSTVDRLLADAGWRMDDLGLLACAAGPGAFTGLRIGIATAKGLAFAARLPLVGVNSLEAVALSLAHAAVPICPMLDARKRQVFAALFQPDGRGGLRRLREDISAPAAQVAASLAGPCLLLGDGVDLFREQILAAAPEAILVPTALSVPRAIAVGWLGRQAFARGEQGLTAHYVRPSDAEMNPKFAVREVMNRE